MKYLKLKILGLIVRHPLQGRKVRKNWIPQILENQTIIIVMKEQAQTKTLNFLSLREQTQHILRELALHVLRFQALHVMRMQALHVLRAQALNVLRVQALHVLRAHVHILRSKTNSNKNCKTKPKLFWIEMDYHGQVTNPKCECRCLK